MEITNIEIDNYRGFKSANVEFHPKLNVFIGSNGAGKTSLLTALIKSIFSVTRQFANPEGKVDHLNIDPQEINYSSNSCHIRSWFKFDNYSSKVPASISSGPLSQSLRNESPLIQ